MAVEKLGTSLIKYNGKMSEIWNVSTYDFLTSIGIEILDTEGHYLVFATGGLHFINAKTATSVWCLGMDEATAVWVADGGAPTKLKKQLAHIVKAKCKPVNFKSAYGASPVLASGDEAMHSIKKLQKEIDELGETIKPKFETMASADAAITFDPTTTTAFNPTTTTGYSKLKTTPQSADTGITPIRDFDMSVEKLLPGDTSALSETAMEMDKLLSLDISTHLYQPVHGSSPGSRYFLIAASPGIRVAARWHKGFSISLRIEGAALNKKIVRDRLKKVGFTNCTVNYGSMHITASDEVLLYKTVGSVLFGIDGAWATDWPDLKRIKGKGK